MKEERYFYVPKASNAKELPQEEVVHATRVLRIKEGDQIYLIDGAGSFFKAEVTLASNKHCTYSIIEEMPQPRHWQRHIHIAIAPTKMMERIEWMAEKATEIGIDEFSFLECQFSERRKMRTDRIEKIVVSAMKQSRKAWMPTVNDLESFTDFIHKPTDGKKYICHCYNEVDRTDLFKELKTLAPDTPVTILIGPEGDFSIEEVRLAMEQGYESVSLGASRLRTETAALSAVMMAQLATN